MICKRFVSDLFQVICDLRKKFGNLYRMFIGNELWIVVAGVKDLEVKGKLSLYDDQCICAIQFIGLLLYCRSASRTRNSS